MNLSHRLVAILLALLAWSPSHASAAARPNIIVILSDDMGFSDIGCYGGEARTPNLDSLAASGIRFTQFYNTARCCPTRASLLTGLHPHQTGIGHMMEDRGLDGYRGNLNRNCVTIAEALKPAGYRSYAVGKWHVTPGQGPAELAKTGNWPLQRGFDRFYGTIHGAGSFWDPSALVRDNKLITVANDSEYRPKEYYYTDAIADHATGFIRDHKKASPDKPFFFYVAFTAAHWPMHAKESDIAKYKGRFSAGYDALRKERMERLKKLGLIDPKWQMSPTVGDWNTVKNREFEERCMEVYAAMIDSMDQGIGRIIAELKATGQFDNTLITFLQDNGGCAEALGRGPGNAKAVAAMNPKPMSPDDQQFNSQPKQTRDGRPVRMGYGVMPGGPDTYISYGENWANVSNTPFREYKHWTHEGGISTPLIVSWPKGIATNLHGRLETQPGQLVDIMATCLDLAEATYPKEHAGNRIHPFEGTSLKPVFSGQKIGRTKPLVWEHEGNRAIREGDWKLVAKGPKAPWELYNLATDRTETTDVAAKNPDKVAALSAQWKSWADRAQVLPWPYANADESKGGNAKKSN